MALDRQSIERKDFPIGRRGYDPEAVDSHLSSVAEEVDRMRASARRRSESLAAAASEQVRAIVDAAESTAAQIQGEAEREAKEIRREARSEAKTTREEATTQAAQYVAKVSESTASMLERLGAIEQELESLVDSLRTGATRVSSDLRLLETNLSEVQDAVTPRRADFQPEEDTDVAAPAMDDVGMEPEAVEIEAEILVAEPEEVAEPQAEPETAESAVGASDDLEGARLIALNMALNGTPRDEVDRYLAENFELSDRASLIEEVYASVEG